MAVPYVGRTVITIEHPTQDLSWRSSSNVGEVLSKFVNMLKGIAMGTKVPSTTAYVEQGGTRASGTVTYSSTSGSTTVTVNGVALATQISGTDSARATADAAAINASTNALIQGVVTAAAVSGVLTVTAVAYGKQGNANTLAATGTGVTASGARLTGGTNATGAYLRRA